MLRRLRVPYRPQQQAFCELIEELCALVDSLSEGFFLNADYLLDVVALFSKLRISICVLVDNCIAYLCEEWSCNA